MPLFMFRDTQIRVQVYENSNWAKVMVRVMFSVELGCGPVTATTCSLVFACFWEACMAAMLLCLCHVNEQTPHACIDELSHSTTMLPHFAHKFSYRASSGTPTQTVFVIFCLDASFMCQQYTNQYPSLHSQSFQSHFMINDRHFSIYYDKHCGIWEMPIFPIHSKCYIPIYHSALHTTWTSSFWDSCSLMLLPVSSLMQSQCFWGAQRRCQG